MIEEFSFGPTFYVAAGFYAVAVVLYHKFFKHEDVKVETQLEEVEISKAA
jgi:hypothetical protein